MTFKAFLIGLLGTFGLPWLLVVVVPYSTQRTQDPVRYEEGDPASGVYISKRDGRITEGSKIYGQEGCYYCHTQVIRPTYAGNDVHRDEWAGLRKGKGVAADTRRETLPTDFEQEKSAHIGISRVGPDLSNFGRRVAHYLKNRDITPEEWVLMHLYNPKGVARYDNPDERAYDSTCPTKASMFDEVDVYGAGGRTLAVDVGEGKGVIADDRARALASYLLSLKKDTLGNPLPKALNYNPEAPLTKE
jgi:cytochrome c oxidase cbb3-type subunit 2